MAGWLQVVLAVLGLLGAGGGLYALLTVPQQRRKIDADASRIISNTVEDLLGSARDQITFLKTELTETRQTVVRLHKASNTLEQRINGLIHMIHDPYMTIDRLRAMVPLGTSNDGGQQE